jgi:hypothetical protein
MKRVLALLAALLVSACSPTETVFDGFGDGAQKLRVVNRKATKIADRSGGVRLSDAPGNGVAWIDGSEFRTGTIEIDIRGQESLGQSYVGVAFHRKRDDSYEAVYLRPFNFRAADPARRQHAVQYISLPDFDWPRLREDFPEQFENPVDPSLEPTGWVRLRVAVDAHKLQVFVGSVDQPTLEVRKLGELDGGQVGLWVGNVSGGDFANLVITPAK